ncbi:MAG: hypothetical protein PHF09_02490 [Candidatus Nanoarchaeia archaeon]|nr:hypothetical protein [Candidatus Nanoarchaeia archaeon]
MTMQVREKTIEEIKEKLKSMNTDLNKIDYLEEAIKERGYSFEIKRFLLGELAKLYDERKMYPKAARYMSNKAAIEITNKEKINSYLYSAELYSKAHDVEEAENIFNKAYHESNPEEKPRILLTKKNIYMEFARDLEKKGKKVMASKFYEKLIKMPIDNNEKLEIKEKLIQTYKALGLFREIKMLEAIK